MRRNKVEFQFSKAFGTEFKKGDVKVFNVAYAQELKALKVGKILPRPEDSAKEKEDILKEKESNLKQMEATLNKREKALDARQIKIDKQTENLAKK